MKKQLSAALVLALVLTSCTPAVVESPAPTPPESLSPVYTDWSKLEPYEPLEPVYTRRQEGSMDTLTPAKDYGPLIPFAGAALVGTDEWSYSQGQYDVFSLYGLMTLKGEVVLDPVLRSAFSLFEFDPNYSVLRDPKVLLLSKVFPVEGQEHPQERYALCARDGSWCTDFVYTYEWEARTYAVSEAGILMPRFDGWLDLLDPATGQVLRQADCSAWLSRDYNWSSYAADETGQWLAVTLYGWENDDYCNQCLLFDPQGRELPLPEGVEWLDKPREGLVSAGGRYAGEGEPYLYGYLDLATGQWTIPPTFAVAEPFTDGVAPVRDGETDVAFFIDPTGKALSENLAAFPVRYGEYWYLRDAMNDVLLAVLDKDLQPVDHPLLGLSAWEAGGGWFYSRGEQGYLLSREGETHRLPSTFGRLTDITGDRVLFFQEAEEGGRVTVTLTDLDGNKLEQWGSQNYSSYFRRDDVTGEYCISAYSYDEKGETIYTFYDMDGQLLFQCDGWGDLLGGMLCQQREGVTTLTDRTGKVVFRYLYQTLTD